MIDRILNMLGIGDGSFNKQGTTRRKHQRHAGMLADVIVADRAYGVKDWSTGGVYFDATPETRLNVGDKVQFLLRFRLPNETVNIMQTGKIVRAVRKGLAAAAVDPPPGCRFVDRCPIAVDVCSRVTPPLHEARPRQSARCHVNAPSPDIAKEVLHVQGLN